MSSTSVPLKDQSAFAGQSGKGLGGGFLMLDQRKKNGKWKGWWEVSQSAWHRAGAGGEVKARPEMGRK